MRKNVRRFEVFDPKHISIFAKSDQTPLTTGFDVNMSYFRLVNNLHNDELVDRGRFFVVCMPFPVHVST